MTRNTLQKWTIWSEEKQTFFARRKVPRWVSNIELAAFYHNFSDAQNSIINLQKEGENKLHPVELKFYFNPKMLPGYIDKEKENEETVSRSLGKAVVIDESVMTLLRERTK